MARFYSRSKHKVSKWIMGRIFPEIGGKQEEGQNGRDGGVSYGGLEAMQALLADLPHQVPNIEKEVPSKERKEFGVRATNGGNEDTRW
jgi:hypothetical protein